MWVFDQSPAGGAERLGGQKTDQFSAGLSRLSELRFPGKSHSRHVICKSWQK